MTLTDLRYIVVLARELHFSRAAEKCFVSQPTLSAGVKKLEEELGVPLFERLNEIRLTPVGEQVVAQAEKVLAEAGLIKELADAGRDPLGAPIKLGAIFTIGPYLFPALIPKLRQAAPRMPLLIQENYTAKLTESLKAGDVDVIIIALPFVEPGIVTLPLYDEPFRVVIPESHGWRERERLAPEELAEESLLLLGAGNCFRDQVLQACPRPSALGGLQKTLEGSSLETIRYMVAGGIGITVLPSTAADILPRSQNLLAVKRFTAPEPARRVALAWRATFPRPQVIDVIRDAILSCALPGTAPVGQGDHVTVASCQDAP